MKFLIVSVLFLFSIKSYAYRFTPQQDYDYQNWKEEQRKNLERKKAQRNAKSRERRKTRRVSAKNLNNQNYRQVVSRQFVESDELIYGWESARLQTSIGYSQGAMVSADSYGGGTTGFRIDIGSHFNLSETWTTTTFARINLDNVDSDSINAPFGLANVEARAYDFGIAQRFLYRSSLNETTISPFVEAHVGRGFFTINESEQLSTGTASAKTELLYSKFTGSAGLQFHFENLLPFVKFEYGVMIFDDVVGYEVSEATGTSRSGNSLIENTETLNYTFNSFSAGFSYLF